MRRILVILAVAAALTLSAAPASAAGEGDDVVEVGLHQRVVQLVADGDRTCALTESGEVYCWGAGRPARRTAGNPTLLLVAIGALMVAAGLSMLLVSRSSPTTPRRAAATRPASTAPCSSADSSSAT
ncbi:RCC1 domain-containing protein [Paractinoplanes atraurantiacus]|uniref:Regulator of chromosome condensation (RCC1) repeat-containing protein n=1 Tax=Paractinoplanes atraurantiacus TaxID=1036182 RepID=A0A285JQA5_9ACTN|nr:RCC1 domain-containing protein [Actinoplanes atraurantiacus]SNY62495.1 Regulator of chromosome condensation (RCC1) repeat-containing protein [Actinoplanes atraurantiacus]